MFDRLVLHLVRLALLATVTGLSGLCAPSASAATPPAPLALMAPTLTGQININTASSAQLQLLPGVGPSTAAKIIAYRERHPFRATIHLLRIKGIGRARFEAIRPYLAVEGETTLQVAGL